VQADPLDDGETLGVARPHGERDGERERAAVLDLDDHELAAAVVHGEDPLDGITGRDAHGGLDDRHVVDQTLPHGDLARGQVPAVVSADPPVERPPVEPRRHQAARVDDGLPRRSDVADGGPVAGGHVGEERQVTAGHERRRRRIELALEPVGPHPVRPDLRGRARPQGAEHGAGAHRQHLPGGLHLEVLAEALERREVLGDVLGDAEASQRAPEEPAARRHQVRIPRSS
jgi:hypothetical protein